MKCKHLTSPVKKEFKFQPTAEKVMITLFWDSQGPILEHYQEKDVMIKQCMLHRDAV
jgi:hypothetical protein